MSPVRYLRQIHGEPIEELTRSEWLSLAQDNTNDLQLAIRHGFRTCGAIYWIERP